ncbi:hypothetical protein [Chitinimonas lacunae]|uniref:Uncharacterized protein n=1 Tax=Chitinimonas lacunae TaxID=1963018 RepID=A0ABV8MKI0_9NEIS
MIPLRLDSVFFCSAIKNARIGFLLYLCSKEEAEGFVMGCLEITKPFGLDADRLDWSQRNKNQEAGFVMP